MKKIAVILFGTLCLITTQCNLRPDEKVQAEPTPVVICFDVEDYTSPDSIGMDDIPKWMAEIMTEEGVTGTFFLIGEKARMMERRGRSDVIDAMARHDIGSHTNYGSIHPTVTEILENAGWQDGMGIMLENEGAGIDDLERIFGQRPANLARHGGSYGPQLVGALGQLGAGYVYSPVGLPDHNVVWFCNTLNFHGEGDFGFFDDAYYRDDLFDPMLEALDSIIPADTKDIDMVAFFACHPSKVRSIQFWDFNYYKGANPGPEEWQTPELRPIESMKTAKKNFRRLVRYLDARDDIELTTYRELSRRFSRQREVISRQDLNKIAAEIESEKKIVRKDHYSPAEIFAALSAALSEYNSTHSLPGKLSVQRPFGPLLMPSRDPEILVLPSDEALLLAIEAQQVILNTGHLPAFLKYHEKKIGAGSLLALFSSLYLDIENSDIPPQIEVLPMEPYPKENEIQIIREVEACKSWPVHREDLDMEYLAEMTRLQLWTLKPAWPVEN
jgi:hypothetical protein